jgi:hypothetical protein
MKHLSFLATEVMVAPSRFELESPGISTKEDEPLRLQNPV